MPPSAQGDRHRVFGDLSRPLICIIGIVDGGQNTRDQATEGELAGVYSKMKKNLSLLLSEILNVVGMVCLVPNCAGRITRGETSQADTKARELSGARQLGAYRKLAIAGCRTSSRGLSPSTILSFLHLVQK